MTIEIAYRDPQEIGALTSFYNEQNAGYPYYCPVSSQTLEAGVWYDRRVGKPHRGVHTEKLIVAEEQGEMVGFAHPALFQPDAESPECIGILRHLSFSTASLQAGQLLLNAAEDYLAALSMQRIVIGGVRGSYKLWPGCWISSQSLHVLALLRMNGYDLSTSRPQMARSLVDRIQHQQQLNTDLRFDVPSPNGFCGHP